MPMPALLFWMPMPTYGKYTVATYFKGVEGPWFFFVSSFYLAFLPLIHTKLRITQLLTK
jgi:hypothetical protein